MSAFLSGAAVDCGPSNVLKNVGGRIDRDFSLHQDRLISSPNVAGPSSRPFVASSRTPISQRHQAAPSPFDLSALKTHLAPAVVPQQQYADQGWANSFVPQIPAPAVRLAPGPSRSQMAVPSPWQADFLAQSQGPSVRPQATPQAFLPPHHASWAPTFHPPPPTAFQPYHPAQAYGYPEPEAFQQHPPLVQLSQHQPLPQTTTEESTSQIPREPLTESQDLLSKTARSLISDAEASRLLEEQPKLRESKFMALMQSLSKGDLVVQEDQAVSEERITEGAKLVPRAVATDWVGDFLGGNAALDARSQNQHRGFPDAILDESSTPWTRDYLSHPPLAGSSANMQRRKSVHFDESAEDTVAQDIEHELDFDEETFAHFNGAQSIAREATNGVGQAEKWGELQEDWDAFVQRQKGNTGSMRGTNAEDRYLFQSRNPYVDRGILVDPGRESPTIKGVLELEAAVQADPTNHRAWYALGLKQQENERENAAITALQKVVSLEPGFRAAYLALAVSYTNEGEFESANTMLERWITLDPDSINAPQGGKLVDRLIDMARLQPDEVDADVQVALGVLFNSSEEYEKAEDCFLSALSVRPNDWLLYNRLGATLANSGRSNEALEYYHRALELHPNFVRALFNLGISHMNLVQYPLAAQRILDALRLQHADATEGYASGSGGSVKGVTSDTLWNTLRNACLHMGRNDLVQLAAKKDLTGFPLDLSSEQSLASP